MPQRLPHTMPAAGPAVIARPPRWRLPALGLAIALVVAGTTPSSAQPGVELSDQPPVGDVLFDGAAVIVDPNANLITIQASDGSIINYERFNIGAGQTVRFEQPGALSRVLNRIDSGDPTMIRGTLEANGIVYLVNPAGITFAGDATIDVGGIYAAASAMSDDDFQNHVHRFQPEGDIRIVDESVTIDADRVAAFIGREVENMGTIRVPNGTLAIAAGEDVVFTRRGGHILIRIDAVSDGTITQGPAAVNEARQTSLAAGDLYALAMKDHDILVQGGAPPGDETSTYEHDDDPAGPLTLFQSELEHAAALGGGAHVRLETNQDLTFAAMDGDLLELAGDGGLVLLARPDGGGSASLAFDADTTLRTHAGDVTLDADTIDGPGTINTTAPGDDTPAGGLTIDADDGFTGGTLIAGNVSANITAGHFQLTGDMQADAVDLQAHDVATGAVTADVLGVEAVGTLTLAGDLSATQATLQADAIALAGVTVDMDFSATALAGDVTLAGPLTAQLADLAAADVTLGAVDVGELDVQASGGLTIGGHLAADLATVNADAATLATVDAGTFIANTVGSLAIADELSADTATLTGEGINLAGVTTVGAFNASAGAGDLTFAGPLQASEASVDGAAVTLDGVDVDAAFTATANSGNLTVGGDLLAGETTLQAAGALALHGDAGSQARPLLSLDAVAGGPLIAGAVTTEGSLMLTAGGLLRLRGGSEAVTVLGTGNADTLLLAGDLRVDGDTLTVHHQGGSAGDALRLLGPVNAPHAHLDVRIDGTAGLLRFDGMMRLDSLAAESSGTLDALASMIVLGGGAHLAGRDVSLADVDAGGLLEVVAGRNLVVHASLTASELALLAGTVEQGELTFNAPLLGPALRLAADDMRLEAGTGQGNVSRLRFINPAFIRLTGADGSHAPGRLELRQNAGIAAEHLPSPLQFGGAAPPAVYHIQSYAGGITIPNAAYVAGAELTLLAADAGGAATGDVTIVGAGPLSLASLAITGQAISLPGPMQVQQQVSITGHSLAAGGITADAFDAHVVGSLALGAVNVATGFEAVSANGHVTLAGPLEAGHAEVAGASVALAGVDVAGAFDATATDGDLTITGDVFAGATTLTATGSLELAGSGGSLARPLASLDAAAGTTLAAGAVTSEGSLSLTAGNLLRLRGGAESLTVLGTGGVDTLRLDADVQIDADHLMLRHHGGANDGIDITGAVDASHAHLTITGDNGAALALGGALTLASLTADVGDIAAGPASIRTGVDGVSLVGRDLNLGTLDTPGELTIDGRSVRLGRITQAGTLTVNAANDITVTDHIVAGNTAFDAGGDLNVAELDGADLTIDVAGDLAIAGDLFAGAVQLLASGELTVSGSAGSIDRPLDAFIARARQIDVRDIFAVGAISLHATAGDGQIIIRPGAGGRTVIDSHGADITLRTAQPSPGMTPSIARVGDGDLFIRSHGGDIRIDRGDTLGFVDGSTGSLLLDAGAGRITLSNVNVPHGSFVANTLSHLTLAAPDDGGVVTIRAAGGSSFNFTPVQSWTGQSFSRADGVRIDARTVSLSPAGASPLFISERGQVVINTGVELPPATPAAPALGDAEQEEPPRDVELDLDEADAEILVLMGIVPRELTIDERRARSRGAGRYIDLAGASAGGPARVAIARLDVRALQRVLRSYREAFLEDPDDPRTGRYSEIRDTITRALHTHIEQVGDYDPAGFHDYLDDEAHDVRREILAIRDVLRHLDRVGLSPAEHRNARREILQRVTPEGLRLNEFEEVFAPAAPLPADVAAPGVG